MSDFYLYHSGVAHDENPPGRGSGRYPYGSGDNPHQHEYDFLATVRKMREKGISNKDIAKALIGADATTTQLRAEIAIAEKRTRKFNIETAVNLLEKYDGNVSAVGRAMGVRESTIRSWLDPVKAERTSRYEDTAEMLKKAIEDSGKIAIDVGVNTELYLGCTKNTKDIAIAMLEKEGYVKTYISIPTGPDKNTNTVVLAKPGTEKSEIQKNKFDVGAIRTFTPDEGKSWWTPEFPASLDSNRIMIRYAEEGGREKDGVIELRRGVEDISLGGSQYAQVRIAVDGTNYMKGMAMYSSDIPNGYDVIYNTTKKKGTPAIDVNAQYVYDERTKQWQWTGKEVLKRMKINEATGEIDQDNPFGALIKSPKDRDGVITAGGQRHYIDKDGQEKLSPINKLQDEGDWDNWSRNLASQFLSKQPLKLINQQLDLSIAYKKNELDEIMNLTNPVIKKKLLEEYANGCDANASDLSAKGFKNQAFQVLLPITDMKETEIYAPKFQDGDTVALIRYPHGGPFEIPILTVNNRQETAKRVMLNATDAVGINMKVADQLSGADCDGDTALVIPLKSNRLQVSSEKYPSSLKDFDPKALYKLPDDAPYMTSGNKQKQMGMATNLITDMTVGGADMNDIIKAVKHSMVVIDAEKHHLDYKQSAEDFDIDELKRTYQGENEKTGNPKGASTILSRASSEARTDKRREITDVNKMTPEELDRWNQGKRVWRSTNEKMKERVTDPTKMTDDELKLYNSGKKVYRETDKNKQIKVTQMDLVDDARDLVRDRNNLKEMAYANYANELKALADQARKEYRAIKPTKVSESARETYAKEVESLNEKLRVALMNSPRERQAQAIANGISSAKFHDNPGMDYEHRQRERARSLIEARAIVGAKKEPVVIEPREWEAIQANAISTSTLTKILNNTNQDKFKQLATPRNKGTLSVSQKNLIKAWNATGMYTQAEIAEQLGISTSAVSKVIRESK